MYRKIAFLIIALSISLQLSAGNGGFLRRIHPGIEWGFTIPIASFHHFNYLDESIGFRINDEGWTYPFHFNAFFLASVDVAVTSRFSCGLLCGYQGVDKDNRVVPLNARFSFYFNGLQNDGMFVFTDTGIALNRLSNHCNQFQIGTGYMFVMAPRTSVSLKLGARVVYDRPEVWDPIEEEYISARNIKRNDAWYNALNFGVAVSF